MEVTKQTVGRLRENCYFITKPDKTTLIVDPGDEAERLKQFISDNGFQPVAIILTHAHFDHIGALEEIREEYDLDVWVHINEADWVIETQTHQPQTKTHYWDQMGDQHIEGFDFRAEHVPGHSPGSVVYIFENDKFAIVGDTLFKGTVGRSDFEYGDHDLLIAGIKRHLATLPPETIIYGGHLEQSTIGEELENNPFLNGKPAKVVKAKRAYSKRRSLEDE